MVIDNLYRVLSPTPVPTSQTILYLPSANEELLYY